jgi:hypothetical protein
VLQAQNAVPKHTNLCKAQVAAQKIPDWEAKKNIGWKTQVGDKMPPQLHSPHGGNIWTIWAGKKLIRHQQQLEQHIDEE